MDGRYLVKTVDDRSTAKAKRIEVKCSYGSYGTFTVEIVVGKSIRIMADWITSDGITFNIGDTCTHDSYNLIYLGTITNITEKTVTIQPKCGISKRLKLGEFCWRNYRFNLAKVLKENEETMLCI